MPRRKWIDKKNATTFQLLHRAQNDPLIHDENASQMVFAEAPVPNAQKPTSISYAYPSSSGASAISSSSRASRHNASRGDLEAEFGLSVRANEGEAAEYGVYYDDTEYDYMQHMRDLGQSAGETVWVEAPAAKKAAGAGKGKQKQSLEEALRELDVADSASQASGVSTASHAARDVFDASMLPSEFVRKTSYQDQQDVPDAIRGFQPDMDPRLREVLEALDDEAYLDEDEHGDFFEALAGDGVELDQIAWEASAWPDEGPPPLEEDDGWETDDTIKPGKPSESSSEAESFSPQTPSSPTISAEPLVTSVDELPAPEEAPEDRHDTSWQTEFAKFKEAAKAAPGSRVAPAPKPSNIASDLQSESILTGTSSLFTTGRHKKRKGALTNSSAFSMTSSSIQRTESMTLLDERFEKMEKLYADDFPEDDDANDGVSLVSGMTGMSKMSGLSKMTGVSVGSNAPRSDFDSLLDDFLGSHSMSGKRRVKRGKQQTGMEQLDEIRSGLGPARISRPQNAAT